MPQLAVGYPAFLNKEDNELSADMTAANIGSGGLISAIAGEMIQHLPMPLAAFPQAGLIALPTIDLCADSSAGPGPQASERELPRFLVGRPCFITASPDSK